MNDLKFAFRQLLRNRVFTITSILILAAGIGSNVAVFRLIYALHFVPLPVASPEQLVAVLVPETGEVFSQSALETFRQQTNSFAGFAAFAPTEQVVRWKDQPSRRTIEYVSSDYFTLLALGAQIGRPLTEADRNVPNLVISDLYWERQFHREPAIVGQTISIQGMAFTIVGVAPPRFAGLSATRPAEGWIPLELEQKLGGSAREMYGKRWLNVFGRLRSGTNPRAAMASLRSLETQTLEPWMIADHRHIELEPTGRGLLPPEQRRDGWMTSAFTAAIMILVMCAALANLAGLQMIRGVNRQKELAVRTAIGASRSQILRHLLLESLLLAAIGGGLGALFSTWSARALVWLIPQLAAASPDVPLGMGVFLVTAGLSVLAAVVVGLLSAIKSSRIDLRTALSSESRSTFAHGKWCNMNNLLVVSQVTISVALLLATGLIWRSLQNRRSFTTGFDPHHVIVANAWIREPSTSPAQFTSQLNELRDRLSQLPGVLSISLAADAPMGSSVEVANISAFPKASTSSFYVTANRLAPHFFETLKVPVIAGRDIADVDTAGAPLVAVISKQLADRMYPNGGALGQSLTFEGKPHVIIGVVNDIHYLRFESPDLAGSIFLSARQHPFEHSPDILIRENLAGSVLTQTIASVIREADPGRQIPLLQSYEQYMDAVLARERATTQLLATAAAVGLALVVLGLYGVLSYQVVRRTRELGLRMALGAARSNVMLLMLRRGLVLTSVGTILGCALGFCVSHLMRSQLYGVEPWDPLTICATGFAILLTATCACWLPARRAANVDPMEALRNE